MKGTKVKFKSRSPTSHELDLLAEQRIPSVVMTSPKEWNPSEVLLAKVETEDMKHNTVPVRVSEISTETSRRYEYTDTTSDESLLHEIDPSLANIYERVISKLNTRRMALINIEMPGYDVEARRTFVSTERHTKVTVDKLADRFCIGPLKAKATMRVTTQRGLRSSLLPLARRYRADRMFGVRRLNGKFATDTLYLKQKSIVSNIASQVFSHKCGFNHVIHLNRVDGEQVGHALADFVHEYGAPEQLTFDGANVQKGANTLFMKNLRRAEIKPKISHPRRPNESPAEGSIRELKKKWYRIQQKTNAPDRVSDFGIKYASEIGNVTHNTSRYAQGRTPLEVITGLTPDITEYLDFGFWDWVTYKSEGGTAPAELGKWLGVSHRVGQLMTYWVMPISGIPISVGTVQRLLLLEQATDAWKERLKLFEKAITPKMEAASARIPDETHDGEIFLSLDDESEEFKEEFGRVIDNEKVLHAEQQYNQVGTYTNM